jgi:hypothetical protein
MQKDKKIVAGIAAVFVAAGAAFWLWPKPAVTPEPETPVIAAPPEVAIQHTVPVSADNSSPLPELASSDATLVEVARSLFGEPGLQWLVPEQVVKRVVVTIDNLPRKKYAERQKPIKPVPGRFVVDGVDEQRVIGAENAARYAAGIQLVQNLDMERVGAEYFRLYPLFQAAYRDLGYPDSYFNDRLVQVIDDLLAAPDVSGPVALVQPNVMYEYADAKLENLSAGQKALIRIGPANAAIVKEKLRELRAVVATHKTAH